MSNTDEIKKALKEDKLIIGTNKVMKNLKLGKLKKIYLASNCKESVKENINHYASLSGVDVVSLRIPNDTLGTTCKKPFSISVLGMI